MLLTLAKTAIETFVDAKNANLALAINIRTSQTLEQSFLHVLCRCAITYAFTNSTTAGCLAFLFPETTGEKLSGVNFINILSSHFCMKFVQSQTVSREKLFKLLMKLTPESIEDALNQGKNYNKNLCGCRKRNPSAKLSNK